MLFKAMRKKLIMCLNREKRHKRKAGQIQTMNAAVREKKIFHGKKIKIMLKGFFAHP